MQKITIRIIAITFLTFAIPLLGNKVAAAIPAAMTADFNKDPFPLKNAKHYDETNDPAFKRCGTNSDGPQHGYFAVPLLVLGLAGVLLYFSKND